MMSAHATEPSPSSMLIVDGDIISRHVIADYRRHCAYAVVEAANTDEALVALCEPTLSVDVILWELNLLEVKEQLFKELETRLR